MTQIELIKAEIERRLNIVEPYKDTYESAAASRQELIWMKDFISSLPQEQPSEDLKKVVMIDNVIMRMTAEGYNNGYKTKPFYEEVLRRLNARKEKSL